MTQGKENTFGSHSSLYIFMLKTRPGTGYKKGNKSFWNTHVRGNHPDLVSL